MNEIQTDPTAITRIHDVLPAMHYAHARRALTDVGIHWYYLPYTAGPQDIDTLAAYQGSFSHTIFGREGAISPLWETVFHILMAALDQRGQQLDTVYRVRHGFNTRTPHAITHSPHIDQGVTHRVGLYYPETTDGDTVVYQQLADYGKPIPAQYTELDRIKPVGNTWADFDGRHFHASTTPTAHEQRLVLTFNYSILE